MEFTITAEMLMTPTNNILLFVGVILFKEVLKEYLCRTRRKEMRKYIFISIGGILGAILRYVIRNIPIVHYHENIPLNTLIINITGSFILALILTVAYEVLELDSDIRLGIATGFIGAYTTFSTLCKETVTLFSKGDYFSAISYVTVSTMLGIAFVYLGIMLAREVVVKLINKEDKKLKEESINESGSD